MARIELRYCTVVLRDGLGLPGVDGVTLPTATATAAPVQGASTMTVQNVNLPRAAAPTKIPVGARFTLASEAVGSTGPTVHVVTGRTQGTNAGADAKQSVTLATGAAAPTGGTFTLSCYGFTTAPIAYSAATTDVLAALVAADTNYSSSDWAVTGAPGAWVVEFKGLQGNAPQTLLTANGADLTGPTGCTVVTIANVQTGVVPTPSNVTTAIAFSPALGAATATYAIGDLISFYSQRLEIKIGEGNCDYTEKLEYKYDLERGNLDAVREGNEVPVEMKFECVYEHITTGTGEQICPMDALKGINGAAEWVTSGPDPCEPHAVDVTIEYVPPCYGADIEYTDFPDFRVESRAIDYSKAMISVAGKCNITQAVVTRVPQTSPQPI